MGNSDALTEILASKEASGKKARGEIYGLNGPADPFGRTVLYDE